MKTKLIIQVLFYNSLIGFLVHTGRYKYELEDKGINREVFSDLKVDPGETYNMIYETQYSSLINQLRGTLIEDLSNRGILLAPPGK